MNILDFAQSLPDHRQEVKIRHLSTDIIFITVAAVICGAQDWEDIEYFGHCKEEFFRTYLQLPAGIPSHDTFNRFFSNIDPLVMEQQFRIWVKAICSEQTDLVSIDGKTICGAKQDGKSLFHMVSAFCHANGVSLAQIRTSEKSNEITAIPLLIKALDLDGCIVSIDAMGCQQAIAKEIREAKADYLLAVKNNQQELFQAIEDTFRFEKHQDRTLACGLDFGHGRIEERTCYVSTDLQYVDKKKWMDVKTLIKVVSQRYNKTKKAKEEPSTRYYISSSEGSAEEFNKLIRSHWAIENNLHWMMDVTMGEDASRKRTKNSPVNFSVVFKTALTMLKKYTPRPDKKKQPSIKTKRKMGGWSDKCLRDMLNLDTND
jgi:predicted transposase YbfD/YdcC